MKSFVRERTVSAGPFKATSIYTRTFEQERRCKEPRGRKRGISKISQQNWNDRKRKRRAEFLIYENFGNGDYYITFTYNNEFLPDNLERALKDQRNTLDKLGRLYKKAGIELKYMWFSSYQLDDSNEYIQRIHHHVIVNALPRETGLNRDDVEDCWSRGGGKNKKSLGRRQTQLIQDGAIGLKKIAMYVTNQEKYENHRWKKGQKRWSSSKNLKEPTESTNDSWWSQRKLGNIAFMNDQGESVFSQRFPGYQIIGEPKIRQLDDSGWHVYIEMLKIEP